MIIYGFLLTLDKILTREIIRKQLIFDIFIIYEIKK